MHWPDATRTDRVRPARAMVVLAGDGLLREAFRLDRGGDQTVLAESKLMLDAYIGARLGASS